MIDVEIQIERSHHSSAAISVVDRAIDLRKQREEDSKRDTIIIPYDQTWCVMDVEVPQQKTLARAVNKANAHKLNLALSNPCFEYWYMLHYSNSWKTFQDNKSVIRELKNHYKNYNKTDNKIFDEIFPKTETAIKHSLQVWNQRWNSTDNPKDCNPSTRVHELVAKIMEISGVSRK